MTLAMRTVSLSLALMILTLFTPVGAEMQQDFLLNTGWRSNQTGGYLHQDWMNPVIGKSIRVRRIEHHHVWTIPGANVAISSIVWREFDMAQVTATSYSFRPGTGPLSTHPATWMASAATAPRLVVNDNLDVLLAPGQCLTTFFNAMAAPPDYGIGDISVAVVVHYEILP